MPLPKTFELNRTLLQDIFCEGLEQSGFDIYGYPQTFEPPHPQDYPTNTSMVGDFIIMPYLWDIPDDATWLRYEPNFFDKKTNTKIWWYKYALRSPEANKQLNVPQIIEMLERLKVQAQEIGSTPYEYKFDEDEENF